MMSKAPSRTRFLAAAAFLLAGAATATGYWLWGLPRAVPDAGIDRLACVSYAPFRADEAPFDADFSVSEARVVEDLTKLKALTSCVRTYAADQGLETVPAVAGRLGMTVMQGAWIGRDPIANEKQIAAAIGLANRYPQAVRAVIVGNEVLLRRELRAADLAPLIARVRAAVPAEVKVTYADVWEFWLKNRELVSAVDFVTIHILPYWEDVPIPVEKAVPHVLATAREVRALLGGKELVIGETGWPSSGRQREGAEVGHVAQARFVRSVLKATAAAGIPANLVEAFDQPWKRWLEGTVGGHWGMFTVDRRDKLSLTGPVSPRPGWVQEAATAAGIALLLGLAGLVAGSWRSAPGAVPAALTGALPWAAGVAVAQQLVRAQDAAIHWSHWTLAAGAIALTLAAAMLALFAAARAGSGKALLPPGLDRLTLAIAGRAPFPADRLALGLDLMRLTTLAAAAITAIGMVVDARYRHVPTEMFLVPALVLALLPSLFPRAAADEAGAESVLGLLLVLCALASVAIELPTNLEGMAWAATLLVLAMPGLSRRLAPPLPAPPR